MNNVSPVDALTVINDLATHGSRPASYLKHELVSVQVTSYDVNASGD